MKHIKEYENINNNGIEIGDYVICENIYSVPYKLLESFLKSNIGRIVKFNYNRYFIAYDDIPEECNDHFIIYHNLKVMDVFRNEIKYWSKSKKDLEIILQSNKYNL